MTTYTSIINAFVDELSVVMNHGQEITVRDMTTKELCYSQFTILNPWQRCLAYPTRKDNIFAKVAETLWMIDGRDDIEWLSFYLPRAPQWSDDGETWRGAYGPRIRNWMDSGEHIDQVAYAVDLLNSDRYSRQATINIWNPYIDTIPGKDIPCNNWIHFLGRGGKMNMAVAQRSSDAVWGLSGIDLFSWSVLLQMVSHWTGHFIGVLSYFIASLHVYDRHWDTAMEIMNDYTYDKSIYTHLDSMDYVLRFETDFDHFKEVMGAVWYEEEMAGAGTYTYESVVPDPFLSTCSQMMQMWNMIKHEETTLDDKRILAFLSHMKPSDLRVSAIEYLFRKGFITYGAFSAIDNMTDKERKCLALFVH